MGKPCVGAMTARACHRYHSDVASKGWLCLALLTLVPGGVQQSGLICRPRQRPSTSVATTSGRVTSVPNPELSRSRVSQRTGVPGLAATDPFCAAWAAYAGTLQALGVAGSFGGLSSDQLAVLELRAAPRLVEAAGAIAATWPAELAAERELVLDRRVGPYARRAQRAVDALVAAGATTDELAAFSASWQQALSTRTQADAVIDLPPLDAALGTASSRRPRQRSTPRSHLSHRIRAWSSTPSRIL